MTSTYAVLSEGLRKRFGEVEALRGLDLAVARGTVCGLLGPNGAGKTTAVRLLATLLRPDAGSARVAGHDLLRAPAAVRRHIGVTGQYASVDGDLTGRQNLRLFARLHRVRGPAERAGELLDRFGLTEAADRPASTYSGGMRRRLDLAASLVRRPDVLFLDEPTTGLDPASRGRIREAVRELAADGTAVLLTTQYLEEADQLADDIALMDRGRIAHTGSPAQFKSVLGTHVEVVVGDVDTMVDAAAVLDRLTGAEPSLDRERRAVGALTRDATLTLPRLVRELDAAGVALVDASLRPPTLDDVFLRLTEERAA
ncbi:MULTISPECIES: ATP-binding cassette domain-containing protein [unclassified Streptomyces]|uniref:ATP-binding cassette domain-containing protein n=1 Tax=unclassified Streptomyces TaxID=2593676 RepID=UPI000747EDDD|nr:MULTISPECIES: ATP-binding cassette domain-containing protein [unclassified Streptomyces]KUL72671.1 ABC transporter [Streptomyces sp. NRRL WC-3604]KUL74514.1 ABC transporter [Streptomyces sp. NRRL WC-3605]